MAPSHRPRALETTVKDKTIAVAFATPVNTSSTANQGHKITGKDTGHIIQNNNSNPEEVAEDRRTQRRLDLDETRARMFQQSNERQHGAFALRGPAENPVRDDRQSDLNDDVSDEEDQRGNNDGSHHDDSSIMKEFVVHPNDAYISNDEVPEVEDVVLVEPQEEDDISIEELERRHWHKIRNDVLPTFGVGLLCLVSVGVLLFILTSLNSRDDIEVIKVAPTAAPTRAGFGVLQSRMIDLLNLTITSPSFEFDDNKSPQWQALSWLTPFHSHHDDDRLLQLYALAVFYFSVNGDGWELCRRDRPCNGKRTSWLDTTNRNWDECRWEGVKCDEDGWVIGLRIDVNSARTVKIGGYDGDLGSMIKMPLAGTLPMMELKLLPNLESITFNDMKDLVGSPVSLLSLGDRLKTINLKNCQLSGSLEQFTELGESSLVELELQGNRLTGTIPTDIGRLSQLERLSLGVGLNGTIPDELLSLTSLRHLDLKGNNFHGSLPLPFGSSLTHLEYLDLSGNAGLDNGIPADLANLLNMRKFYWSHGSPVGDTWKVVVQEWCDSASLSVLDLTSSRATGPIDEVLSSCTELKELKLEGNPDLYGSMPQAVCDSVGEFQSEDRSPEVDCGKITCSCCLTRNCAHAFGDGGRK